MARIETYPIDTVLSDSDLLFGTNADDSNATVNFTVGDLKTYILQGMANGTVTSVSGVGTVSGLTLTGTVTTSGDLTLGGTLALTSSDITTGLGYTPPTTNTTYDYGAVGAAGNISMKMTGSDATNDIVVMQAGTNITLTDNGSNVFTIDAAGGSGGVASFTNANGTFVSAAVANTTATGTVTMGVIDLSATGTPSASTFLRGDNTWATPAGNTVTGTLPITALVVGSNTSVDINNFTGADGTTGGTKGAVPPPAATDNVKFLKGDGTWTAGGSGTVTSVAATHGGDAFVAAVNNDPSVDPSVDITMGGNNTQYINGAGNLIALTTLAGTNGIGSVTSVDGGTSTFVSIAGGPITTAGTLTASLSATGTPSATTFLRGDNTWATVTGTGTVTSVAATHGGNAFAVSIGNDAAVDPSVDIAMGGTSAQYINGAGDLIALSTLPAGTVSSVDVSGGTTGLTTSGGPITTSGVITLAGTLAAASGGTGKTSYTVADLLYANTTSSLAKLGIGTTGQVLAVTAGGLPSWETISGTGTVTEVTGATSADGFIRASTTNTTSTPVVTAALQYTGTPDFNNFFCGDGTFKPAVLGITTTGTSGAANFDPTSGILNIPEYTGTGTVTSVALTAPSAFTVTGSPITSSGILALAANGTVAQYIDGTGALQDQVVAAGAAGDVQFNDGSNGFAAESAFNYNTATNTLTVQGVTNQPSLKLASEQQVTPGLNSLLSEIESYYSTSEVGKIKFVGEGAFNASSAPSRLELQTTSSGSIVATTKATIKATGQLELAQYGTGTFTGTAAKNLSVTASGQVIETDTVSGGNINEMATRSLDVDTASFIAINNSNTKLVLTNSDVSGVTKTVQIRGGIATLGTNANGIMTIRVQSSNSGAGQTQITYASPSGSVNIGIAAAAAAWILTFAYYGEVDMVLIDATAI